MLGGTRTKRRGISYILSVAVMTFVTVSMASVVLFWSIGQVSQSQNVFSSAITARVSRAMERFTVEDVLFLASSDASCSAISGGSTNGCLKIYVRNVGSIQLVIDAVYINNQIADQTKYSPLKLSVGMQQVGSILVLSPIALSAGTTYQISVASTRGNTVALSQTY